MIRVQVLRDIGRQAAEVIIEAWSRRVREAGRFVLGLATGSTPVTCYHEMVRLYESEGLTDQEVAACRTFNLDEYLPPLPFREQWRFHSQSYHVFMAQHLFSHLPFATGATRLLNPAAADIDAECEEFERAIEQAGGIDLQLLGIGANGHIGFCEPGSPFDGRTARVRLDARTIADNAEKYFEGRQDRVPREALSMGMATITSARSILLLATGESKATAVASSVLGPVTTYCPASALQDHGDCTYLVDEPAAALLLESLRQREDGFGEQVKPGQYTLQSEAGISHSIELDDSLVVDTDLDEEFSDRPDAARRET